MGWIEGRAILEQVDRMSLRLQEVLLERKHITASRFQRSKRVYRSWGHEDQRGYQHRKPVEIDAEQTLPTGNPKNLIEIVPVRPLAISRDLAPLFQHRNVQAFLRID